MDNQHWWLSGLILLGAEMGRITIKVESVDYGHDWEETRGILMEWYFGQIWKCSKCKQLTGDRSEFNHKRCPGPPDVVPSIEPEGRGDEVSST